MRKKYSLLIILFSYFTAYATLRYVKQTAIGLNNGSSWANAHTSLVAALGAGIDGDTILVAAGIYIPNTTNNASIPFILNKNYTVMGGFSNSGNPTINQRNIGMFPTIISGKLTSTNSTSLIRFSGPNKSPILDGFFIESGTLSIDLVTTQATVALAKICNCIFRNMNGTSYPGASMANAIITSYGFMMIENSFFKDMNLMYNSAIRTIANGKTIVNNSVFYNITTDNIIWSQDSNSLTEVNNCNFVRNTPYSLYQSSVFYLLDTLSQVNVRNSIFYDNFYVLGAGINSNISSMDEYRATKPSKIRFVNCSSPYTQLGGSNYYLKEPLFQNILNCFGADNLPFTSDDGLILENPCSFGINNGDNTNINFTNDILGMPRIQAGVIDLGAYESLPSAFGKKTVYVNLAATGLNNGSSWTNAYTNLFDAFEHCSDTIKIATGIYYFDTTKIYYKLKSNQIILGGYPSIGYPSNAQRNPSLYPTRLSGQKFLNSTYRAERALYGMAIDSVTIDGISLEGFSSKDYYSASYSNMRYPDVAVFLKSSTNINFKNIQYINNTSKVKIINSQNILFDSSKFLLNELYSSTIPNIVPGDEVSINCKNSKVRISNTTVFDTFTPQNSYLHKFLISDSSTVIVDNSLFRGIIGDGISLSGDFGAALIIQNKSNLSVNNSLFDKLTGENGASIYSLNSIAKIDSCQFTNNYNGTILSDSSNIKISKSIFSENTSIYYNKGKDIVAINNSLIDFKYSINEMNNPIFNSNYEPLFQIENSEFNYINSLFVDKINNTSQNVSVKPFMVNNSKLNILNSTLYFRCINDLSYNDMFYAKLDTASKVKIYNSIVTNTLYSDSLYSYAWIGDPYNYRNIKIDIKNSLFYNIKSSTNISSKWPRFVNQDNPRGKDGLFFTSDDGLQLAPCSPAINTGSNIFLNGLSVDFNNSNRVIDNTVDMGAYEYQAPKKFISKTSFVNANIPVNGNGKTWASPYNNLNTAFFNSCSDTFYIAQGEYTLDSGLFELIIERPICFIGSIPHNTTMNMGLRDVDKTSSVISSFKDLNINPIIGEVSFDNISFKSDSGFPTRIIFRDSNTMNFTNCRINNHSIENKAKTTLNLTKTVFTNCFDAITHNGFILNINRCIFDNNERCIIAKEMLNICNSIFSNNDYMGLYNQGAIQLYNNTEGSNIVNNTFVNNFTKFPSFSCFGRSINSHVNENNVSNYIVQTKLRNNLIFDPIGGTCIANSSPLCNRELKISGKCMNYDIFYPFVQNNLYVDTAAFVNFFNPIGPDSLWFTNDDGLRLSNCMYTSKGVDSFSCSSIDIKGDARIQVKIDNGAYEYSGVNATIYANKTNLCTGETLKLKSRSYGSYSTPSYQWEKNGVAIFGTTNDSLNTTSFSNNDSFRIKMVFTDSCLSSKTIYSPYIKISVSTALTPTVSISTNDTMICLGNTAKYYAQINNLNGSYSYQWKINGVSKSNLDTFISYINNNGDTVQLAITSAFSCVSSPILSNKILIKTSDTSGPLCSIVANKTATCQGDTIRYVASISNAGFNPKISWYNKSIKILGAIDTVLKLPINTGDSIYCKVTSFNKCAKDSVAFSNAIKPILKPVDTIKISITTSNNFFCTGDTVKLSSIFSNSGNSPKFSWTRNGIYIAGATDSFIHNTSFGNNDTIQCYLINKVSNCLADTIGISNKIILQAYPTNTPSISISQSNALICSGKPIQFNSNINNGGSNPTYQWYKNNAMVNGGINSSFTDSLPKNGDSVYCKLTSSNICAKPKEIVSNLIVYNVTNSVIPSITINASSDSLCIGTDVNFNSTVQYGGTSPSYQWYKNNTLIAGANSNSYTSISPSNNDSFYCKLTSNQACASPTDTLSNKIKLFVTTSLKPSINIATTSPTICVGSTLTLTSTINSGGSTPTYQWYKNRTAISGATNSTYTTSTAQNNDTFYCKLTSSITCANPKDTISNFVNINVSNSLTPTIIISSPSNTICAGSTVNFTSTITNGGLVPTYTWKINNTIVGNSATFSSSTLKNEDTVKAILTSNSPCANPNTVQSNIKIISVIPVTSPSISIFGNIILTNSPSSVPISSSANAGTTPSYQWQDSTSTHTWMTISGQTLSTINYSASVGNKLRCNITSFDQCASPNTKTSNVLVFTSSSSINLFSKDRVVVFPNPTEDEIFIQNLKVQDHWTSGSITDVLGRQVMSSFDLTLKSEAKISLKFLANGIYYLNLFSDDSSNNISFKIAKQ